MKQPIEATASVLLLGSGGLRVGQAGEFDYSGSQAIKALKEEGMKIILVNPNIATVQTDPDMADVVYLQPLNVETIEKIIQKERPRYLLLGFGGQTALNLGLSLEKEGILQKYGITVLGTSVESIRLTEDRNLFKQRLDEIGIRTPQSISATTVDEAIVAAKKIGYPVMMRAGFSLGGLGSGKVETEQELKSKSLEALSGSPQILIEEYLKGWKELEYEIVRDHQDQALTICNMENFDPMGIHTGESIVVAPSQTLSNDEYHLLRSIAIRAAHHFNIIGECNVQFALNPLTSDYRVIEMNARLSRSSALASKATGYPLAFVAAKLALGYRLDEISNSITGKTTAFFEPALDYIVVKIPRWDTHKLKAADRTIGTEMKSIGEVMAIGRTFAEALQKGVRMLNLGQDSLLSEPLQEPILDIQKPTDRRLFALYHYFREEGTVEKAHEWSHIDRWFLNQLFQLAIHEKKLQEEPLSFENLLAAKRNGFADSAIARFQGKSEEEIRSLRQEMGILPYFKQIDTLAGEFDAKTNYLYATYWGQAHDIEPSKDALIVLGSGPYRIGSSVEFDWSAVNTARSLRKHKVLTILINSNPETVSTDFDESDRLYFEELTFERIRDIADFERPKGLIVSVGGQIANNLALPLHKKQYPILGTPAGMIDAAENREKFSTLLHHLNIDQPPWQAVTSLQKAKEFGEEVGYPLLIRPSYVLSGAAMNVVENEKALAQYLKEAAIVSPDHPVVLSKFIENAKELEIDGVAKNGQVLIMAIAEHIENAGVHSGDATIVLPPQKLYLETIRRAKKTARDIAKALQITGPFNIQYIAKENAIQVIECNVRASRSLPFVSKVVGINFIDLATEALLGIPQQEPVERYKTLELDHIGVKTSLFSYRRLKGSDPVTGVEMASTGEVANVSEHYLQAFFSSWLSTEQSVNGKKILVSIGADYKLKLLPALRLLEEQCWDLFATKGTHDFLSTRGVKSILVHKISEKCEPNITTLIAEKKIDLIINIPKPGENVRAEGFKIRRLAIDHHVPLITNLQLAAIFLQCLTELDITNLPIMPLYEK